MVGDQLYCITKFSVVIVSMIGAAQHGHRGSVLTRARCLTLPRP